QHCRQHRRPYMLEATVSRLYGHSSASGAMRVKGEADCLPLYEQRLLGLGVLDDPAVAAVHAEAEAEVEAAVEQVLAEPPPRPEDLETHTYAPSPVDQVYPDDFTTLPG